jgi:nitric oxide reductase subunit B
MGKLRKGKTVSGEETATFIEQLSKQVPGCVGLCWDFIISAMSCKPPFAPQGWYRPRQTEDLEYNVRHKKLEISNRIALYWAVGCAIFHFIGAGIWGFAHTLPVVNRWTHGTQVTASHGHMAFFGAYAMVILTMVYYALPKLKGLNQFDQKKGFWVFWITTIGMMVMGLAFGVAGVIQSYMQRALGMDFLVVQGFMRPWFIVVLCGAIGFTIGVIIYIFNVVHLARKNT